MSQGQTASRGPSDEALVAACRQGRKEAFGELVSRHQDRVFNLAWRMTGSRDDAAEITQDAFLKAWRAMDSFRSDSAFYTWIFRIAVNTVRSRRRFQAVRPREVSLDVNPGADPETAGREPASLAKTLPGRAGDPTAEAERAERRALVEKALNGMSVEQRLLIVLRDMEGKDYGEIADVLDCPRGTVKSRLHRARMALRDRLAPVLGPDLQEA